MKRTIAIVAALGLSACAGAPGHFHKDGASAEHFRRDAYDCERDTRQVAPTFGPNWEAVSNARAFAIRCMASKGYRFVVDK